MTRDETRTTVRSPPRAGSVLCPRSSDCCYSGPCFSRLKAARVARWSMHRPLGLRAHGELPQSREYESGRFTSIPVVTVSVPERPSELENRRHMHRKRYDHTHLPTICNIVMIIVVVVEVQRRPTRDAIAVEERRDSHASVDLKLAACEAFLELRPSFVDPALHRRVARRSQRPLCSSPSTTPGHLSSSSRL
jgi:hypothetical protein